MTPILITDTTTAASWISRHRRWVILAMLLSLHAGLMSDSGGNFQRIWLMVHFGLFLIWQPFVSTNQELKVFAILLLLTITGVDQAKRKSGNVWLLAHGSVVDIRPAVFQFAVDNGLKVLAMQKTERGLEEVFKELTKG